MKRKLQDTLPYNKLLKMRKVLGFLVYAEDMGQDVWWSDIENDPQQTAVKTWIKPLPSDIKADGAIYYVGEDQYWIPRRAYVIDKQTKKKIIKCNIGGCNNKAVGKLQLARCDKHSRCEKCGYEWVGINQKHSRSAFLKRYGVKSKTEHKCITHKKQISYEEVESLLSLSTNEEVQEITKDPPDAKNILKNSVDRFIWSLILKEVKVHHDPLLNTLIVVVDDVNQLLNSNKVFTGLDANYIKSVWTSIQQNSRIHKLVDRISVLSIHDVDKLFQ